MGAPNTGIKQAATYTLPDTICGAIAFLKESVGPDQAQRLVERQAWVLAYDPKELKVRGYTHNGVLVCQLSHNAACLILAKLHSG